MNTKADVRTALVPALIAIAVLAIVWFFLFGPGEAIALDKIRIILPGFGFDNQSIAGTQILRYDISSDKVQYHDGNSFINFEGQTINLEGKKLNYNDVYEDFSSKYYYNTIVPETFQLQKRLNTKNKRLYENEFSVVKFDKESKGQPMTLAKYKNQGPIEFTYFILTLDNQLLEKNTNNQNKIQVGEIQAFNIQPVFNIFLERVSNEFSQEALTNLRKIEGLTFPHKRQEFEVQTLSLKEALERLRIDREIIIGEYTLRNIKLEENSAEYQFYTNTNTKPLEIYLNFERDASVFSASTLSSYISAIAISQEDFTLIKEKDEPENEIVNSVAFWRDAILENTILIHYEENNERKSGEFCVTKIGSKFLVIDLNQPVTANTIC